MYRRERARNRVIISIGGYIIVTRELRFDFIGSSFRKTAKYFSETTFNIQFISGILSSYTGVYR